MKRLLFALIAICLVSGCAAAEDYHGLKYESSMELMYANQFTIDYFEDGYKLIRIHNENDILVVPENKDIPHDVGDDVTILQQPLDAIYMANTAAMSLIDRLDAIESIRYSSQNADHWYIESAVNAMENGTMLFAGKYSEPDYEMLLSDGCDLAIENTMILHSPKVREMLELLDIPVLVDHSSYEEHPLGKVEWIRMYGALLNLEDRALEYFDLQRSEVEALQAKERTDAAVAFFYLNDDNTVVIRGSKDYIPTMIDIAGGKYIFSDMDDENSNSPSITMSMEQFYAYAMDTDYIIYNGTVAGIDSVDDLLQKNQLFADFKAVANGNVWTTDRNLFQATDALGTVIADINRMLNGSSEQTTYIRHLN